MHVLIVDDHKLFAEAIQMALEKDGLEAIVASSGAEAQEAARITPPDVILLDLGLPDRDGLALGRDLLEEHPEAKIVVVTSLEDERVMHEAVRAGFHGFLTKDTKLFQFVRAVRAAADGQLVVPQRLAARRPHTPQDVGALQVSQLTPKEREVISLLSDGAGSGEIARVLQISPNTVRTHVQSILAKLQVHSRLEAVAFAARHGLVRRPSAYVSLGV
jgi:DNA-binding NarL/FixJ family response regulator